ncbi:voltage-dependent anion-selective channel-like [Tropilaelaps mercedesae]|uniref:Voltage-dependent anion-selective channel-like n=1 Tax=Tropilaelaps mercedesae TaxID=418985 RepID=A0A1V9XFM3_9ACAR|nr:voltage-dependent anion-selective channel-like [Tropilaelaps mercedesae]
MVSPPRYVDLSKSARDLLAKNYHFGLVNLDCKAKSHSGVDFNAVSTLANSTGKATASLEVKYKLADHGITLKEKWSTDNTLNTELLSEDCLLRGLKLLSKLTFNPQTNQTNGTIGAALQGKQYHAAADMDYRNGMRQLNASLVYTYRGFLVGSLLGFTALQAKPVKTSMTLGYVGNDISLLANVNDFKEFGATMHHQVQPDVKAAATVSWDSSDTRPPELAFGGVFDVNKDTTLRGKVNSNGLLGLSLTHRLREGICVTMSASFELKDFHNGHHKMGLGIDLEG